MRRALLPALFLLAIGAMAGLADDAKDKDKEKPKPATPAEEYQGLVKEYQDKQQEFNKAYREAKTNEERQKAFAKFPKPGELAPRFLKLAEDNAKNDVGFDAAAWIVQNVRVGAEATKALKLLAENAVDNKKIGQVCLALAYDNSKQAEDLLRGVLEKNPNHDAQGMACYGLASYLKNHSQRGGAEKLSKEAESLFERAAKEYAAVKIYGRTIGDLANGELFEMRFLVVGKEAPDIEGEDIDAKKFKLSDYRGKVVVLDFWGNW
jgi:hypothetical protein